jgi:hypothetical protein
MYGVPEIPRDLAMALFQFSADLAESGFIDHRQVLQMYLGHHTVTFKGDHYFHKVEDRPMVVCPECKVLVSLDGFEAHFHDHATLLRGKP